jgi:hypothetical protein
MRAHAQPTRFQDAVGMRPHPVAVQRKCASCGGKASNHEECPECRTKREAILDGTQSTASAAHPFMAHPSGYDFSKIPAASTTRNSSGSTSCPACGGSYGISGPKLSALLDSVLPSGKKERANTLGGAFAHQALGVDGRWVASQLTNGRPLDPHVRSEMEERFGTDFSGVRIHTDQNADILARTVNANAFTIGQNIAFADDRFDPASPSGQKLLAHELAHAVQQKNVRSIPHETIPITKPDHTSEREADAAAVRFASGLTDQPSPPLSAAVSPQLSLSVCGVIVEASCWAAFSAIAAAIALSCTAGSVITLGGLAIPCTAAVIGGAGLCAASAVGCTALLKDAICGEHNLSSAAESPSSGTPAATAGA